MSRLSFFGFSHIETSQAEEESVWDSLSAHWEREENVCHQPEDSDTQRAASKWHSTLLLSNATPFWKCIIQESVLVEDIIFTHLTIFFIFYLTGSSNYRIKLHNLFSLVSVWNLMSYYMWGFFTVWCHCEKTLSGITCTYFVAASLLIINCVLQSLICLSPLPLALRRTRPGKWRWRRRLPTLRPSTNLRPRGSADELCSTLAWEQDHTHSQERPLQTVSSVCPYWPLHCRLGFSANLSSCRSRRSSGGFSFSNVFLNWYVYSNIFKIPTKIVYWNKEKSVCLLKERFEARMWFLTPRLLAYETARSNMTIWDISNLVPLDGSSIYHPSHMCRVCCKSL